MLDFSQKLINTLKSTIKFKKMTNHELVEYLTENLWADMRVDEEPSWALMEALERLDPEAKHG